MLPVYVVSMCAERLSRTVEALRPLAADVVHVPGVDGAAHRDDERVSRLGRILCTDRMIGCALAHHDVARRLLDDGHAAALVLEDDVFPLVLDVWTAVAALLEDDGWEIATLFCQGLCSARTRFGLGSTAAYLLRASAARTMVRTRISYHADYIRNSLLYRTRLGPQLFGTRDARRGVVLGGQDLAFWMRQDVLRLGAWDVTVGRALVLAACLAAAAARFAWLRPALLAQPVVLQYYMTYETQRASRLTALVGTLVAVGTYRADAPLVLRTFAHGAVFYHVLCALDTRRSVRDEGRSEAVDDVEEPLQQRAFARLAEAEN